jgi:hypothetical protein
MLNSPVLCSQWRKAAVGSATIFNVGFALKIGYARIGLTISNHLVAATGPDPTKPRHQVFEEANPPIVTLAVVGTSPSVFINPTRRYPLRAPLARPSNLATNDPIMGITHIPVSN